MKANKSPKSPMQIEGHRSAPASPSLSVSDIEGIYTKDNKHQSPPPPKSPLIARDSDSLDSDNYEEEGQQIQDIYLNNNNNNNNNDNNIIDNHSVHNSEINMNMPQSPIKQKKRHKKPKRKRKNRKRKMKHKDDKQVKRIKKQVKQIKKDRISLISDDENESNISYSVNSMNGDSKANAIYISDSDSDSDVIFTGQTIANSNINQPLQPIFPDFPNPSPINNRNDEKELDMCQAISNMDLNRDMDLDLRNKFGDLNIRVKLEGNKRTRRPSPPPCPPQQKWNQCDLNPSIKRGLESNEITIPTKEMISLVKAINNNDQHLMYSDINAKNRLLALIVSIIKLFSQQPRNMNIGKILPQILLIAPRRHLALEARELLLKVSKFFEINCSSLVGGMPTFECIQLLSKGIDVITGTPGKLCNEISKGRLNLNALIAISFNGADELRSMPTQMHYIIDALPKRKIRVIWCESMITAHSGQEGKRLIRDVDKSIQNMSQEEKEIKCMNTKKLNVCNVIKQVKHIVNYVKDVKYDRKRKYDALYDMLRYYNGDDIMIYFNTRHEKDYVFNYISKLNEEFSMMSLDGRACNEMREETIKMFRHNGGIFFVTDLMNDNTFEDVIVINYDIPKYNPNTTYVKRVCSSNARIVFNLVDDYSKSDIEQIAADFNVNMMTYYDFS
eukprot:138666_1